MDSDVFLIDRLVWLYHNARCERLILRMQILLFLIFEMSLISLMFLNSTHDVLEVCSHVPSCMMLVVQIAIWTFLTNFLLSSPFEACKVGWGSKISSDHIKIWCYWHDSLVIFRSFFHINFLNAVWQEWGHNTQNVVQFLSYYFSNRKRPWGGRLSMFNITFCWLSLSHPFLFSLVKYAVWRALSVAKRRYKIAPLAAPLVTGLCPILIIIICSMLLLSFSNFEGGRPSDALSLGYSW